MSRLSKHKIYTIQTSASKKKKDEMEKSKERTKNFIAKKCSLYYNLVYISEFKVGAMDNNNKFSVILQVKPKKETLLLP